MKNLLLILSASLLLFSCRKEMELKNDLNEIKTNLHEQSVSNTKEIHKISESNFSSCYNEYLSANFRAMSYGGQLTNIHLGTLYISTAFAMNSNELFECRNNNYNNNESEGIDPFDKGNIQEVAVIGSNTLQWLQSHQYQYVTNKSYLDILIEAKKYASSTLNFSYSLDVFANMAAISKAIDILGYTYLFVSQGEHNANDGTAFYVYRGIEILSGRFPITASDYNKYLAKDSNSHVAYPIIKKTIDGVILMQNIDQDETFIELPTSTVTVNYNTSMSFYLNTQSIFDSSPFDGYPEDNDMYYSNGKFYSDQNHINFVPNGIYRLPYNYPSIFHQNNYFLEIRNGLIVNVLGIK